MWFSVKCLVLVFWTMFFLTLGLSLGCRFCIGFIIQGLAYVEYMKHKQGRLSLYKFRSKIF